MKLLLYLLAFFSIPVICGLVSSYRAGQKPIHDVYLRIKKFAQWEKWPVLWRHTKTYYAYYGLAIILLASAFG